MKKLLKTIGIGLGAIAFMVLLALPFNIGLVFEQYVTALSEYPYFTINALNFWGMLGLNWDQLTTAGTVIGYIILALIVALSAYVFFKSKNNSKYYFVAAILAFFTFMLSTKMHERYGFPVMIFLLLAFIEARNLYSFALYVIVSLSQFYNIAWVLFLYETDTSKYAFYSGVNIASAIAMLVLAYMVYVTWKLYVNNGTERVMIAPGKTPVNAVKSDKRTIARPKRSRAENSGARSSSRKLRVRIWPLWPRSWSYIRRWRFTIWAIWTRRTRARRLQEAPSQLISAKKSKYPICAYLSAASR